MLLRRSFELTLTAAFAVLLTGCTGGDSPYTEVRHDESEAATDHHGHGSDGVNGGAIVELGNEEFHAEVVVDEPALSVEIFILGSDAATAKPIAATEISLSFKHGDAVEEFKLAADPLEGDPEGQSSFFTLASAELFEELHEHPEGATLSIVAGDESLTGTVIHSHDHGDAGDHGAGHGDDGHGDDDDGDHPKGDGDGEGHKHGKGHDDDGDEHAKDGDKAHADDDKADSEDGEVKAEAVPAKDAPKAADAPDEAAAKEKAEAEPAADAAKKE